MLQLLPRTLVSSSIGAAEGNGSRWRPRIAGRNAGDHDNGASGMPHQTDAMRLEGFKAAPLRQSIRLRWAPMAAPSSHRSGMDSWSGACRRLQRHPAAGTGIAETESRLYPAMAPAAALPAPPGSPHSTTDRLTRFSQRGKPNSSEAKFSDWLHIAGTARRRPYLEQDSPLFCLPPSNRRIPPLRYRDDAL